MYCAQISSSWAPACPESPSASQDVSCSSGNLSFSFIAPWHTPAPLRCPGWPFVHKHVHLTGSNNKRLLLGYFPGWGKGNVIGFLPRYWCKLMLKQSPELLINYKGARLSVAAELPDHLIFSNKQNRVKKNLFMQLVNEKWLLLEELVWSSDFNLIFNIPYSTPLINCYDLHTEFKSCLRETECNFQKIYLIAFQNGFPLYEGTIYLYKYIITESQQLKQSKQWICAFCSFETDLTCYLSVFWESLVLVCPDPWVGFLGFNTIHHHY